jgi:hypothetical protein
LNKLLHAGKVGAFRQRDLIVKGYSNNGQSGYYNTGYDVGYRDGVTIGQKDSQTAKPFRPQKNDRYADADNGYNKR